METDVDLNDNVDDRPSVAEVARLNGLLKRSVVVLRLGKESDDKGGYQWT